MVGWLSEIRGQTGSLADWMYAKLHRRTGEAAAHGEVECGPYPDFATNTLAFVLQLKKSRKNNSQGNRRALGYSAPNAIRSVDCV